MNRKGTQGEMSSDRDESPPSSPVYALGSSPLQPTSSPLQPDPQSSPLRQDPPSSPIQDHVSSSEISSSDNEYEPPQKRFSEAKVPQLEIYWPPNYVPSLETDVATTSATAASVQGDDELLVHPFDEPGDLRSQSSDSDLSSVSLSSSEESSSSDCSSEADSSETSDSEHYTCDELNLSDSIESSQGSDSHSDSDDDGCILKVWEGSQLTVDEGVLSLMEIFVNQSVQKSTMSAILKCVLKFLPDSHNVPQTQFQLFKYVYDLCPLPQESIHFYCAQCHFYHGRESKKCESCGSEISNRFFQLSLENQIRNLFEKQNLADHIDKYNVEKETRSENGIFMDICDGSEYKRVILPGQYNLTLVGHTDGVSVTESSNVSLWPLEYFICELPPNLRFKFLLVNGVWLDESKPNFNTYYGPFADEGAKLHKDGITWVHPKTGITHTSRVTIPIFVVDAPVRSQIQNILCIGGRHSCNVCEQKMLKLPAEPVLPGVKKKARKRIFAFSENPSILRNNRRMKAHSRITLKRRVESNGGKYVPKKGVLGPSVVSKLPNCDRSTAVFPEYMHLLRGIIRQFMELWFESKEDLPYSLKKHREEINAFLLSIRVPDYVTRIPRSTESYSKWKANELRSFLLYYSPIIMQQFMSTPYFKHWILFVSSMQMLLGDRIPDSYVIRAETMLRVFIRNFAILYKPEALTYNLHNLLHLAIIVRRWGNLQYISTFQFESFNGTLAKFIHGSKNQGKELINNVRLLCGIGALRARVESAAVKVSSKRVKLLSKIESCSVTGYEQQLLEEMGKSPARFYYRAAIGNEIYTSSAYLRQVKRNNYTVCFENALGRKMYGAIKYFLECVCGDLLVCIHSFVVDHLRTLMDEETGVVVTHIVPISESEGPVELVPVKNVVCKVIRVGHFVCLRPNKYEVNL